jgi:hypothetical protein
VKPGTIRRKRCRSRRLTGRTSLRPFNCTSAVVEAALDLRHLTQVDHRRAVDLRKTLAV